MLIDKLLSIPKTWVYINLFQNDCWVSNYTHYETIVPTVFTCFVFSNPENNGDHLLVGFQKMQQPTSK